MKKTTLSALRAMARRGAAVDITEASEEAIRAVMARRLDKVGYSAGIYGANGGLLADMDTGDRFVILARNANLFRLF